MNGGTYSFRWATNFIYAQSVCQKFVERSYAVEIFSHISYPWPGALRLKCQHTYLLDYDDFSSVTKCICTRHCVIFSHGKSLLIYLQITPVQAHFIYQYFTKATLIWLTLDWCSDGAIIITSLRTELIYTWTRLELIGPTRNWTMKAIFPKKIFPELIIILVTAMLISRIAMFGSKKTYTWSYRSQCTNYEWMLGAACRKGPCIHT